MSTGGDALPDQTDEKESALQGTGLPGRDAAAIQQEVFSRSRPDPDGRRLLVNQSAKLGEAYRGGGVSSNLAAGVAASRHRRNVGCHRHRAWHSGKGFPHRHPSIPSILYDGQTTNVALRKEIPVPTCFTHVDPIEIHRTRVAVEEDCFDGQRAFGLTEGRQKERFVEARLVF